MNTNDIEKIVKMFEKANISHLDLEIDNIKIKLDKNTISEKTNVKYFEEAKEELVDYKEEPTGEFVNAPLVGTYYQAPSADAKPFVSINSKVKKGDKLCIIEAMKVMNEITAPIDGIIKEIYIKNEEMVEYGQKLFLIGD